MDALYTQTYPSPLGDLLLGALHGRLVLCDWLLACNGYRSGSLDRLRPHAAVQEKPTALLDDTVAQLNTYFTGHRQTFDLPLQMIGTPFQTRVWQALLQVPYGATCSYQDMAHAIGNPRAVRAVAGALRNNPVSVIVPCHRVIGKNGRLTGYNGGTDALYIKERLLAIEQRVTFLL